MRPLRVLAGLSVLQSLPASTSHFRRTLGGSVRCFSHAIFCPAGVMRGVCDFEPDDDLWSNFGVGGLCALAGVLNTTTFFAGDFN